MIPGDEEAGDPLISAKLAIARAFGAENRARLLARYFQGIDAVPPAKAWQHVYRLLLWIDRTND